MKPTIKSRRKERQGRGYSIPEVVEASIEWQDFNRMGIRIDPRRKTVYPKNVESLEEIKKQLKPVKEQHKKPKKIEKAEPQATEAKE